MIGFDLKGREILLDERGDFVVITASDMPFSKKWHNGLSRAAAQVELPDNFGPEVEHAIRIAGEIAAAEVSKVSAELGVPADPDTVASAVKYVSDPSRLRILGVIEETPDGMAYAAHVATCAYLEVSSIAA